MNTIARPSPNNVDATMHATRGTGSALPGRAIVFGVPLATGWPRVDASTSRRFDPLRRVPCL